MKNISKGSIAGFTLIELLVVVLIIGILAFVAVPQYNKAVMKARTTEAITTVNSLRKAMNVYYMKGATENFTLEDLDIKLPEMKYHELYAGEMGLSTVWGASVDFSIIPGIGSYHLSIYTGEHPSSNYTQCSGKDCTLFTLCKPMEVGSEGFECDL